MHIHSFQNKRITLVITVYITANIEMNAKMPINLYESLSNLKSAGGGYNIAAIKPPLLVRKPVLITLASAGRSP